MKEPTPQALVARKTRDRLAFLALPPAEAQRRISLAPADLARELDPVEIDLSYSLGHAFPGMKTWTPDDLTDIYLRLLEAGVEFVVIGDQAVNLWSRHYSAGSDSPTAWAPLQPLGSRDLDLLGGRLDAAVAAEAYQVETTYIDCLDRGAPPQAGTLHLPNGGGELIVHFLHTPFGARREEIRATALHLPLHDRSLSVMHPLLCLESKVECLFGLPQNGRQDLKHVRLSILCLRGFLCEIARAGTERELLTALERIAALTAEEYGIRLQREHQLPLEDAIPWPQLQASSSSLPKLAAFLAKRWPQLASRIDSRRKRYADRFE